MNCLVDTHILIWSAIDPEHIPIKAVQTLSDSNNGIFVSTLAYWEISVKYTTGRLKIENLHPDDFPRISLELGYENLPISASDAASFFRLPLGLHRDPFDRMLAWLAIRYDLTLITVDPAFREFKTQGLKLF